MKRRLPFLLASPAAGLLPAAVLDSPSDLHRKALAGCLSTLNEPAVIREAPAKWPVHVGYPVFRASLAKAGTAEDQLQVKLPEQLMQASPNLVAAIRIAVEWRAPRQ